MEEIKEVNDAVKFCGGLDVIKDINLSVSEYQKILNKYAESYNTLKAVQKVNLLDDFCQKYNTKLEILNKFFNGYENMSLLIKNNDNKGQNLPQNMQEFKEINIDDDYDIVPVKNTEEINLKTNINNKNINIKNDVNNYNKNNENNIQNLLNNCKNKDDEIINFSYSLIEMFVVTCQEISKRMSYGIGMLVSVLKGGKNKQLLNAGFENCTYYSCLGELKTEVVEEIVSLLLKENVFIKSKGMYPVIKFNNDKDINNINNDTLLHIYNLANSGLKNNRHSKESKPTNQEELTKDLGGVEVICNEDGEILTNLSLVKPLKDLRRKIATEKECELFMVCSNKVLVRLATYMPQTKEEFLRINGIGERWFNMYGKQFESVINNYRT